MVRVCWCLVGFLCCCITLGSAQSTKQTISMALQKILKDGKNAKIREAALYSLANRQDGGGLDILKSVALTDSSTNLQRAATYAIGNMRETNVSKTLQEIYSKSSDNKTKEAALYSIANSRSIDAKAFLVEIATTSDDD